MGAHIKQREISEAYNREKNLEEQRTQPIGKRKNYKELDRTERSEWGRYYGNMKVEKNGNTVGVEKNCEGCH